MQISSNNLRTVRKRCGMTLRELAKKANVSIGSIGNYETGTRGMGPSALKRIADILRVDVADISPKSNQEPRPDRKDHAMPTADEAARYNAEAAIRAVGKLPERDRALGWLWTMLMMLGSGLEDGGDPTAEKIVNGHLAKLFKHARGEPVDSGKPPEKPE
jgi:transcriptional regulator with XRE-family HTH domain